MNPRRTRSQEAVLRNVWQGNADDLLFLSQASHGLGLIAAVLAAGRTEPPRLWFPDYYCEGALALARAAGAVLEFYPVTRDLEPDWAECRRMVDRGPPDLFAIVHYFGRAARVRDARSFCSRVGALLLEDCAHLLCPAGEVGRYGDFACYSPRKFLDIPDAGLLAVRGAGLALRLKEVAETRLAVRNGALGWRLRRLVRSAKRQLRSPRPPRPLPPTTIAQEPPLASHFRQPWMSTYSRLRIAEIVQSGQIDALVDGLRSFHADRVHRPAGNPSVVAWTDGLVSNWTGLLCADEHAAAETINRLRRQNERIITWPGLPPEVKAAPDGHGAALDLRRRLLLVAPRDRAAVASG